MYTATYRLQKKEMDGNHEEVKLKRFLPQDSDESTESEKANEYLKHALGSVLGLVLIDCSLKRPNDPVGFVADAFDK